MSATVQDSTKLEVGVPNLNGKQAKRPISIPQRIARWRSTPPNSTALILLALRVLVYALALSVALIVTPGIVLQYANAQLPLIDGLILLGIAFGILNALVRPLLLLVTGGLVIRTMGFFLFVSQLVLFLIVDWWLHPFVVEAPTILWFSIASVVMTFLVLTLE